MRNVADLARALAEARRRVPLAIEDVEETELPFAIRRRLTYAAEPGDRVPAGTYFYRATGPNTQATGKILVLK